MTWETKEDIGSYSGKLNIGKDGNDSLFIEHKEEIQIIFHKSMNLLIGSKLNINNRLVESKRMNNIRKDKLDYSMKVLFLLTSRVTETVLWILCSVLNVRNIWMRQRRLPPEPTWKKIYKREYMGELIVLVWKYVPLEGNFRHKKT